MTNLIERLRAVAENYTDTDEVIVFGSVFEDPITLGDIQKLLKAWDKRDKQLTVLVEEVWTKDDVLEGPVVLFTQAKLMKAQLDAEIEECWK